MEATMKHLANALRDHFAAMDAVGEASLMKAGRPAGQ